MGRSGPTSSAHIQAQRRLTALSWTRGRAGSRPAPSGAHERAGSVASLVEARGETEGAVPKSVGDIQVHGRRDMRREGEREASDNQAQLWFWLNVILQPHAFVCRPPVSQDIKVSSKNVRFVFEEQCSLFIWPPFNNNKKCKYHFTSHFSTDHNSWQIHIADQETRTQSLSTVPCDFFVIA